MNTSSNNKQTNRNTIDYYFKVVNKNNDTTMNLGNLNNEKSKQDVTVFSDGSCFNNGKKNAIGGIGIYNETTNESSSQKIVFDTFNAPVTNNVCEIFAIYTAISKYADSNVNLKIITDSMYCVNIFTKWASSWRKNNWTKKDKKPIQNLELIKKIYNKNNLFNITYQHCNSHKPEPDNKFDNEHKVWFGNDMADKLASLAMNS